MNQQRTNYLSYLKMSDQAIECEDLLLENIFLDDELDEEEKKYDEYFENMIKDVFKVRSATDHEKSERTPKMEESTDQTKANINMINIPCQCAKEQSNDEQEKLKEMNLHQFIQYLSLNISKDKNMNVTKKTLIYLYSLIQNDYKCMKPLERDDKRNKQKIYMKLHSYSNKIVHCFETNPQKYLSPVIFYSNFQKNLHKNNIKRVIYLRKMLNLTK